MTLSSIARPALAATALLAATLSLAPAASAADRIRYQCAATGATDISMSARYEIQGARRKFSTEFEARPGLGYVAGARLGVQVNGVKVGTMVLVQIAGGARS